MTNELSKSSRARTRTIALILLMLYSLVLIKLILFKNANYILSQDYRKNYGRHSLQLSWQRANLVPGKTLYYYLSLQEKFETGLENIGGNILLFIPYGILLPLALKRFTRFSRFFAMILLTSLFFELSQLLLAYGSCDVDDIILNGLGGIIGYSIFRVIWKD
jgi:glycopeptide antibiotics resistance protein